MGQMTETAWKNTFGTLPLQLRRWRDWQDYGGFQNKQKHHCTVASVELKKYAIGNEMSNQQFNPKSKAF